MLAALGIRQISARALHFAIDDLKAQIEAGARSWLRLRGATSRFQVEARILSIMVVGRLKSICGATAIHGHLRRFRRWLSVFRRRFEEGCELVVVPIDRNAKGASVKIRPAPESQEILHRRTQNAAERPIGDRATPLEFCNGREFLAVAEGVLVERAAHPSPAEPGVEAQFRRDSQQLANRGLMAELSAGLRCGIQSSRLPRECSRAVGRKTAGHRPVQGHRGFEALVAEALAGQVAKLSGAASHFGGPSRFDVPDAGHQDLRRNLGFAQPLHRLGRLLEMLGCARSSSRSWNSATPR